MSKGRRIFGELELTVLEVVRTHGPSTVKKVQQMLGGHDRYTTVMTVLTRLAEKGELQREKAGRHYVYWLEQGKKGQFKGWVIDAFKRKVFGGRSASMIAYLLESSTDISDDEIDELQKLIDKAKGKERSQ